MGKVLPFPRRKQTPEREPLPAWFLRLAYDVGNNLGGLDYEQTAEALGLTVQQVRDAEASGLRKLRPALRAFFWEAFNS